MPKDKDSFSYEIEHIKAWKDDSERKRESKRDKIILHFIPRRRSLK